MVLGRRPNGTYLPRFRNVKKKDAAFLRDYGFQGGGQREGWQRGVTETGFGPEFKRLVSQPGAVAIHFLRIRRVPAESRQLRGTQ
jgi:hypothetical protein